MCSSKLYRLCRHIHKQLAPTSTFFSGRCFWRSAPFGGPNCDQKLQFGRLKTWTPFRTIIHLTGKMVIYGVFIISKSGGLIFNMDHNIPKIENEKTFSFPLDLVLEYDAKKVSVAFGERDGICVGHVLSAINGVPVNGTQLEDETRKNVKDVLDDSTNYPINLKFIRPKMTTNEKIVLASTFYPLFAIASQLSPEPKSSGIEVLETDAFKLNCFQTLTGVKFMVISEPSQLGTEALLRKMYELYSDYALKNPFYSLEMPIRCELFDINVQALLETVEKTGSTTSPLIKT